MEGSIHAQCLPRGTEKSRDNQSVRRDLKLEASECEERGAVNSAASFGRNSVLESRDSSAQIQNIFQVVEYVKMFLMKVIFRHASCSTAPFSIVAVWP
jgi:hypothetical protein